MSTQLEPKISTAGAVAISVSSMVGAGLFVVFSPAAAAAGSGLFLALAIAGLIAGANAISSSRLAARFPESGGAYRYATRTLHPAAGHIAGWAFVVGKTASCAVMASAIGEYVFDGRAREVGTVAIVVLTLIALSGVNRSTTAMMIIASVAVGSVIATAWVINAAGLDASAELADLGSSPGGVLQAAALLFFAFAGYARITTMGEEVKNPAGTIPRAVTLAVLLVGLLYLLAGITLVRALGAELSATWTPWSTALHQVDRDAWVPLIAATAALTTAGALLSLCIGVSRTLLAMARDGHLPAHVARVNARSVSAVAQIGVAIGATVALWTLDLAASIGFSSCCVLIYYALAQASALRLPGRVGQTIAALGLLGCLALAFSLPIAVWAGTGALLAALSLTRARSSID